MKMYGKAQSVGNTILEAFRAPESLPKALAPLFIHRKDDKPCRKWSWSNQLITALQGTDDARGFKQWQAVDRHVKKGAKAFNILAPCTRKVKDEESGEERIIVTGFRACSVFRIQDTEGEPIPDSDPEVTEFLQSLPLRGVAEDWGLDITAYSGEGGRALGWYGISPIENQGKAIALGVYNLSTFLHELTHAADHRNEGKLKPGQYWRQEVVAELGSSIIAQCLGLDYEADLGGCFEYVEKYARDAKKDTVSACIDCLDRTCKAVALILDTAEALKSQQSAVAV